MTIFAASFAVHLFLMLLIMSSFYGLYHGNLDNYIETEK